MRRAAGSGWFWTAVWAAMLLVHLLLMGPFAGQVDLIAPLLLGGSALATFALAMLLLRAGDREPGVLAVADASMPSVLAAVGFAGVVVGLEIGEWSIAMGGGLVAAGVAGLVRERRTRSAR